MLLLLLLFLVLRNKVTYLVMSHKTVMWRVGNSKRVSSGSAGHWGAAALTGSTWGLHRGPLAPGSKGASWTPTSSPGSSTGSWAEDCGSCLPDSRSYNCPSPWYPLTMRKPGGVSSLGQDGLGRCSCTERAKSQKD